jgi:hypothetical protein
LETYSHQYVFNGSQNCVYPHTTLMPRTAQRRGTPIPSARCAPTETTKRAVGDRSIESRQRPPLSSTVFPRRSTCAASWPPLPPPNRTHHAHAATNAVDASPARQRGADRRPSSVSEGRALGIGIPPRPGAHVRLARAPRGRFSCQKFGPRLVHRTGEKNTV